VYGSTGWIGGCMIELLKRDSEEIICGTARLENKEALVIEINTLKPDYIINAAGLTGRPNVDWCEDHKQDTIRVNVVGALNLFDACYTAGVHLTNFGTGCIYQYDSSHPVGSGIGFKETDEPNYIGSFYSYTKKMVEQLLPVYPNALNLRLRMPISDDLHPRNFVTKITHYEHVVNIPNSVTMLYDLLPIAIEMTKRKLKGIYNFTNPGAISHNQVLALYKEYIDTNFTWKNFTEAEQAKILKAGRSNNELDVSKLLNEFPNIPHISIAIVDSFKRMKHNLNK